MSEKLLNITVLSKPNHYPLDGCTLTLLESIAMLLEGSGAEQEWRLSENEEDFPGQGSQAVLAGLGSVMSVISVRNTAD